MSKIGSIRRWAVTGLVSFAFCTPALAEDLVFTFENDSSYDVIEFYASPYDVDDWEDDILGTDILPSGESIDITIADGREQCEYDFKIVVEGGDEVEKRGVDLCETGTFTLHD